MNSAIERGQNLEVYARSHRFIDVWTWTRDAKKGGKVSDMKWLAGGFFFSNNDQPVSFAPGTYHAVIRLGRYMKSASPTLTTKEKKLWVKGDSLLLRLQVYNNEILSCVDRISTREAPRINRMDVFC